MLRHRIITNFHAEAEGVDTDNIVKRLLESVTEPTPAEIRHFNHRLTGRAASVACPSTQSPGCLKLNTFRSSLRPSLVRRGMFQQNVGADRKPDRTAADVEEMIHRAHASRLALGAFKRLQAAQTSPLGLGNSPASTPPGCGLLHEAQRYYGSQYMALCKEHNFGPFDLGFAHEALARVEGLRGNTAARDSHLAQARDATAKVTDAEDMAGKKPRPTRRGDHGWPLTQ